LEVTAQVRLPEFSGLGVNSWHERRPQETPLAVDVALLIGLQVLYVLSSGPMQILACHRTEETTLLKGGGVSIIFVDHRGTWWPKVYAPLVWASQQRRGASIHRYWMLFPVPVTEWIMRR
jgi:hypothetical protein